MKTIQQKFAFWSGICLLVTVVTVVAYSAYTLRNTAEKARTEAIAAARKLAGEAAENFSGKIRAELDVAIDAARTMAQTFSGVKDANHEVELGRDEVNSILKIILERNLQFIGTYTCWEPDAFDGMDRGYMDSEGHDATGRFIPYWNRNQEGQMSVEALVDYDTPGIGDYYQVPKATKQEAIIDPYIYPVQGEDTLLTSLVVPVLVEETFYGIAGVDLRLDFLQGIVDNVQEIYDGNARIAVISNNGTLAAVTGRPELAGKPMTALQEVSKEVLAGIRSGFRKISMDGDYLETYTPFSIGSAPTSWSVSIRVPKQIITAGADQQMAAVVKDLWIMIALSAIPVAAALTLLWFITLRIARPIKTAIHEFTEAADRIASASGQMTASSQQLAEGASEQASSNEETSASLEEMASMTKQNADNAAQADNLMKDANLVVTDANEIMAELTGSMSEISTASEDTSKIIKTIDEIAFQTNLLALNAAVEAARAGEAGAGFAVVADEVRNLALRAAEAARNTADLIEGTVKKVAGGSELVAKTNDAFSQVADNAQKVGELVGEISAASVEQAQGIDQISEAVTEMDKVVQQNAASAQESASASEEMNGQAEKMKSAISELSVLVGGIRNRKETSTQTLSPKQEAVLPHHNKPMEQMVAGKNEVTPNQVIELENRDISDF